MELKDFRDAVKNIGLELSDDQLEAFNIYKELLKETNKVMNLTAIIEDSDILEKHFYDSLLSIKHFDYQGSLCDVGSGAGFPGLVLKIAYPSLKVTLLEPIAKRCRFLNEVIDTLKLKDIEVVNKRAEDFAKTNRESFDIVTARAVKSLDILSELCIPLIKVDGNFIILKGSSGLEEIDKAKKALDTLGVKVSNIYEDELLNGDKRIIAIYHKTQKTSLKYPRDFSLIKKKPL